MSELKVRNLWFCDIKFLKKTSKNIITDDHTGTYTTQSPGPCPFKVEPFSKPVHLSQSPGVSDFRDIIMGDNIG